MSALDPHKLGVRVYCTTCRKRKKPWGRSVPFVMSNSFCDEGCAGYDHEPKVGSLWPDESEKDFGYPVGTVGTRRGPAFETMVIKESDDSGR